MDQSIPSSKETRKIENDSFHRKSLSNCESAPSSDVQSLYEINVHENFSSESNSSKGSSYFYVRPKLMVKVKKLGGNKEESNRNTHSFVENLKKIANPLIESYYPFLEDHQIGNITIEVNVSPVNSESEEIRKKKENADKNVVKNSEDSSCNKPNESPPSDKAKDEKNLAINSLNKMRKRLKRKIIQNILKNKDGEFKDVQWKDIEQDQLHIHHHEHHHHYYVDATKLKDDSRFSLFHEVSNSPVHWSEDKENEFRRRDILNADFDVRERERPNYLYDCNRRYPVNFLMDKNNCNLSNLTFVRTSKEYMKIADKYSSRTASFKSMKKASSMDSFSRRKSEIIVFHNYSDTEISKCDSEEGSSTDVPSSRSTLNLGRVMKKTMKTEHKRSKLWEERDVVGNVMQRSDSNCSVIKKKSDEKCDEKKKTSAEMEKMNKKQGNDLVDKLKASQENSEESKGEFEILVEKKAKKSVEVDKAKKEAYNYCTKPVLSSECEPDDTVTDKETSVENVKSTSTTASSAKGMLVKTTEDALCKSRRKCSKSKTPKPADNNRAKLRKPSSKKIDNNEQVASKSKQTFGISGGSKSKDKMLSTARKSDQYLDSRKGSLQFWSEKLRQELKEMKRELRSLERKHMREVVENRLAHIRAHRPDEYLENGISVYSSRTYIVGASHFKLLNDLQRKRDYPTSFKNRNTFTQKQITYLYSSPKTRGWGGVHHHTESKFSTKEKGFYWNQHFVSRERKKLIRQ